MIVTIIAFLIILGVLVFVHELGHFLTAKKSGVKVEEFGFGFPPRILGLQFSKQDKLEPISLKEQLNISVEDYDTLSGEMIKETIVDEIKEVDKVVSTRTWRWFRGSQTQEVANESEFTNSTIYSFNWIPLGGFVKIKGEGGEQREEADSFGHKSFLARSLILSAGVLMNVILAFLLFSIGYMAGLPTAIEESQYTNPNISNIKVQITSVAEGSAAASAGLVAADQIISIDGQEIKTIEQVQNYIFQHQEQKLVLQVKSNRQIKQIELKPTKISVSGEAKVLGVGLVQIGTLKYNFFESWYRGAILTISVLVQIILAFYELIKNLIIGAGVSADLAGPVGVAVMTGKVVNLGWSYILQFTALLSLNLAVINFLPFPALDGGRFLFLVIEKIRRKPNNQKIENIIHNLGFSLLMILVIFVTYKDVIRYGSGFIDKLKNFF
jgi:regulator of sigma E protease